MEIQAIVVVIFFMVPLLIWNVIKIGSLVDFVVLETREVKDIPHKISKATWKTAYKIRIAATEGSPSE